jgi:signal transduction histidine kinase
MLDAKRALLLAISHELRSPLTRARVNAELLDDTPERAALMDDLGAMRDLITDLLEGERLASGHSALQAEPTDIAALVRDLVETQFGARPITLSLASDLGRWPIDPARIRLLLRNLIGNALRHGTPAARAPEVFVRRDGTDLLIGVRDHGPGVAVEHLARLSEAFYRPDSARSRASGGVGLGLYLCRLVAQAHGGRLTFRNAEPGLEALLRLSA